MYAVKHNFASTTMNLTKDCKKSTKQLQGSKKSKIMAQDTSNSDTDSTYNTESESNYTEHLPRHHAAQKQQDNIHDHTPTKTSKSSTQSASRRPNFHASPFQTTQRATARPVLSAPQHISQSQHIYQPSQHLNMSAKSKHFHTVKHSNHH